MKTRLSIDTGMELDYESYKPLRRPRSFRAKAYRRQKPSSNDSLISINIKEGGHIMSKEIPQDYALVLRRIGEDGEDDFGDLAELIQVDRSRLRHIVDSLQHKGLVTIRRSISLSSKGRRLLQTMWPELVLIPVTN